MTDQEQKYYAVKEGRQPGIYFSWLECSEQVTGYKGAIFKSFNTMAAAEDFLQDQQTEPVNDSLPLAYIDGSFSKKNNRYGYGGYIFFNGRYHIIQGTGNNPDYIKERNIAGELLGALRVVFKCMDLKISEINLYCDYAGTREYITETFKAKTPLATYYKNTIDLLENDVKVHFIQVKGHSGIEGNEIADLLAKEAAGVAMRKKDIALLQDWKEKKS